LNNGQVNLDLVKPTGVDRCVDGNDRWPAALKTLDAPLTAVNGAIIHDPKNACCRPIGLLAHHLADQAIKGFDAVLAHAAAEEFGAADIPGREVDPGSLALVLVLDESRPPWGGRKGGCLR